MAIELTFPDLQALNAQAEQQGERIHRPLTFGQQYTLPKQLGEAGQQTFNLRNNLRIGIRSGTLHQTIRLQSIHGVAMPLVSKFYLSGRSRVLTPNIPEIEPNYQEVAGRHYLYCLPDLTEFEEWGAREAFQVVYVFLPLEELKGFWPAEAELPAPLQQALGPNLQNRFHQPLGPITMAMERLLRQLLGCPYQGVMRQLYLEAKALELLALQLAEWTELAPSQQWAYLRPDDIDRLHQARAIVQQQMESPPSLLALARQVRLSDRKLKQGFRQVFGTTVFGYLHQLRLERARQLLAVGAMSVTEVAYTVGYSSLPSFSKAFRKRYGSSPLQYAKARNNVSPTPDCN